MVYSINYATCSILHLVQCTACRVSTHATRPWLLASCEQYFNWRILIPYTYITNNCAQIKTQRIEVYRHYVLWLPLMIRDAITFQSTERTSRGRAMLLGPFHCLSRQSPVGRGFHSISTVLSRLEAVLPCIGQYGSSCVCVCVCVCGCGCVCGVCVRAWCNGVQLHAPADLQWL